MTRWFVALTIILGLTLPAHAGVPKKCAYEPHWSKYQPIHTRYVHKACRDFGMPPTLFPLIYYRACTIFRTNGKRWAVPIVVLPPKGSFGYKYLRRHELAHVNCRNWVH